MKQFTLEKKNKEACCPFLGQHRSARVSTMMVLAFHNTWSPAGARLTAPGAEVLTEIKLLEGVLITQVSGYRECLLLLSKTLEVMVSSAVRSMLCSNHWTTRWSCQDCIMLERVNGRKSTSSSWRFFRGHPEATFEWVVAGNTRLPPTERKVFLLLCMWNWRTLATGEREHQAMQQHYREALISIYYILP